MTQNRYKLRKDRSNKAIIKTVIFCFFFLFAILMYFTYSLKSYTSINGHSPGVEDMFTFLSFMFSSEVFDTAFTKNMLIDILKYQIHIWWVYVFFGLLIYLATNRKPNDYKGVEHGSGRWEDKEMEKDFADRTGIPIGNDFYVTVNNPKDKYYKPNNLNEIVIGGSGAGKSYRKIKPDIMQMYGSYVITDPKGELYRDTAKMLESNGYKIRVLNLIDINMSNSYNPFRYMVSEQDVLSVADLFMKNSAGDNDKEDFWSGAAQDLLIAIMLYLWKSKSEIKSFGRVIRLVSTISYKDGFINPTCELARCMKKHSIENPNDAVTINWNSMCGTPEVTMGGIAKTLSTRLRLWAVESVDILTNEDEIDFDTIGTEKTAVFLIIPAARQTYKAVANIFYSQLFERLMYIANNKYNGRLPLLVSCELDEFANIGKLPNFNETLSVVRSYNIRICPVLQGLSQLKALYEKTFDSIIGNCSIFTFLGTNDMDTKKYVVERLGKTTVRTDTQSKNRGQQGGGSDSEQYSGRDLLEVNELALALRMKGKEKNKYGGYMIAFIDDYRPFFLKKFNTSAHPQSRIVGSSFKKDWHNNTDINAVYSKINAQKKLFYEQQAKEAYEKNHIDLEEAEAAEAEKKYAAEQEKALEQKRLSEIFNQKDFKECEEQKEQPEETDFEADFEGMEEVNPIINNFK